MSTSPDSTLVMLGLTGSGKTNFLVALDVVLEYQTSHDGLCHDSPAADRSYLQPLREQWLRGEELLHTSRQNPPPPHHLLVRHPPTGATAGLHLPDLAGETFEAHFATRSLPAAFRDRLREAGGVLLFLHSAHSANHAILEDPAFMEPNRPAATPVPAADDWKIEDAARQVKLVDLLQVIAEIEPRKCPLRVAVMISAWDLVENVTHLGARAAAEIPKNPAQFLPLQWPLLDQFLRSHPSTFSFRAFGVSARGGGKSPTDIARLTALDRPADRILLVDGDHRSNDLTRPVRWLLGMLAPAT
jgi:hypothetical protein